MIADTDWSYLAGLIDGEGCIRVEKGWKRRPPSALTVCFTNSNPKLIEWVFSRFGGKLYSKKHQNCWDIYWLCSNAQPILEGILPYLVAKREQAELALAFLRLLGKQGERMSPGNINRREVLMEAMTILKSKQGGKI